MILKLKVDEEVLMLEVYEVLKIEVCFWKFCCQSAVAVSQASMLGREASMLPYKFQRLILCCFPSIDAWLCHIDAPYTLQKPEFEASMLTLSSIDALIENPEDEF